MGMGIRVPIKQAQPTDPAQRAWLWAAVGGMIVPLFGIAAGAALGYYTASKKRDKELLSGEKNVPNPTLFNGGLGKGFLTGALIGTGVLIAGIIIATPILSVPVYLGASILAGAFPIVMGLKGALTRRDEMRGEYQQAEAYQQAQAQVAAEKAPAAAVDFSSVENHPAKQRGDRKWVEQTALKPSVAQGQTIA